MFVFSFIFFVFKLFLVQYIKLIVNVSDQMSEMVPWIIVILKNLLQAVVQGSNYRGLGRTEFLPSPSKNAESVFLEDCDSSCYQVEAYLVGTI